MSAPAAPAPAPCGRAPAREAGSGPRPGGRGPTGNGRRILLWDKGLAPGVSATVAAAGAQPGPLDWCEKHRPRRMEDLVGNGPAVKEIQAWAEEWRTGVPKERALVLAGEPGVGKTSAAHALASDMGWGVIEMNASDTRNEEVIKRIAGAGASNRAFALDGSFSAEAKGRQVVILDEADNLFGREDRGGMKAILDVIRDAKQPIILIANDLYELQRRGAALKTLARTVKFGKVHSNSIPPALRRIAKKEGVELEVGVDKALAERAGGDLRSAVNDLQALALGRDRVALADVEALGKRDTTGDVWGMLGKVFYGTDPDEARRSTWDLDETPDNLSLWIDQNLPVMYTDPRDLAEGYKYLSKATVFLGRVQRRQQFGLWSYATELMTAGVAVAKRDRPRGARFEFPLWLRRQSTSKAVRELRDRTAGKVGAVLHTSRARARSDVFPYLKMLMQGSEDFAIWCAWRFELDAEEVAFLLEAKSTSAAVKKMVEEAHKRHGVPARMLEPAPAFGRYDDAEPSAADDEEDDAPAPRPAAALADDDEEDEDADADDDEDAPKAKPAPAAAPLPAAKPLPAPAQAEAEPAPKAPRKAKEEGAKAEPKDEKKDAPPAKKPQRSLFEY